MTFPPDSQMLVLLALWVGEGLETEAGNLYLTTPDGNRVPVPPAVLDSLEEREWLVVTEAGAVATDRGIYALNRWITAKARQRGQHGRFELKSARVSRAGRVA